MLYSRVCFFVILFVVMKRRVGHINIVEKYMSTQTMWFLTLS